MIGLNSQKQRNSTNTQHVKFGCLLHNPSYSGYCVLLYHIMFHDFIVYYYFIHDWRLLYMQYNAKCFPSVSPLKIRNKYIASPRITKTQNKERNHLANKRYMVFSAPDSTHLGDSELNLLTFHLLQ